MTHNTTELVASHDDLTDEKCIYIGDPVTDEEFESIWRAPLAITITEIWCETDAGTVIADLEIEGVGAPAAVNDSDITCIAPDGTTDSSFAGDTTMAVGDRLDLDLGDVITAVRLTVCWKFTVD
jgi:hypothetical protein